MSDVVINPLGGSGGQGSNGQHGQGGRGGQGSGGQGSGGQGSGGQGSNGQHGQGGRGGQGSGGQVSGGQGSGGQQGQQGAVGSKLLSEVLPAERIPEKFKGKSVEDLLTSYSNAESTIGKRASDFLTSDDGQAFLRDSGYFQKPGENASPEEREAFLQTLGRPASAEEYQLPETSEELPINKEYLDWYRKTAFENGMSQQQFQDLALRNMEFQKQSIIQMQNQTLKFFTDKTNQSEEATAYNHAVDDKGVPVAFHAAQLALNQLFPEDLANVIRKELYYDPRVVRMLAYLGKDLKDDTAPGGEVTTTVSLEAVTKQIADLREELKTARGNRRGDVMKKISDLGHTADRLRGR